MKIPINHNPSTSALAGQEERAKAPPTLIELAPTGELILVELQGSLEVSGFTDGFDDGTSETDDRDGLLGKFVFEDGRMDRPTLLISHHRLEGKFVTLQNPIAVLRKEGTTRANRIDEDEFDEPQAKRQRRSESTGTMERGTSYDIVTVVRRKLLFSKRPEPVVRIDEGIAV